MRFFDAASTADLLRYPELVESLSLVMAEYDRGEVVSPERLAVPCGGERGILLSMPCHARDLVAHKLLTIYAGNTGSGIPAIQGHVSCFSAVDGTPLFCLDGPTVTARRTAAVTMIGIRDLCASEPTEVVLIGTGAQAFAHVQAVLEIFPAAMVRVRSRSSDHAVRFCESFHGARGRVRPDDQGPSRKADVVVAATSAKTPVYRDAPMAGRLVVGVGSYRLDMIEIGAETIAGSQIYVDDLVGAPTEAGDVVAAGTDWSTVKTLASSRREPPDFSRPIFLKSVGCAAWDLAACRTAVAALRSPELGAAPPQTGR